MFRCLPVLFLSLVCTVSAATKPNVVLITLESTRADRMGFLGGKAGLTPSLDALARRGIVFDNAYAQAPLTTVSHATILTGTYPQAHGVTEFGSALSAKSPYLPDVLHANGYRTAAFVGSIRFDPHQGYAPGFNRGFDTYHASFHPARAGESRYTSVEARAADVITAATSWLERVAAKPFFLWIQLNDPGDPYQPPAPYSTRFRRSPYDGEIASTDAAVGRLIAFLGARKLAANTLIIVTADHGESLGAHGEDTHGIFLYDDTIHVPLLLKLPGDQLAGKKISNRVQLVDVAPTVLDALAVAVPSTMQGDSLLRVARTGSSADRPAYARTEYPHRAYGWSVLESWRTGKYLMIRAPHPELYDLSKDPGAKQNLASSMKATLDTLAGQLDSFDKRLSGAASAGPQLSSSEIQKLASLGYVGLQQRVTGSASVGGIDPKDKIAVANATHAAITQSATRGNRSSITSLQQIAAQNPEAYLPQYSLGVALNHGSQYKQAIAPLRKAITLLPEAPRASYEMALAFAQTGNWKDCATHLEIVVSRLPEFSAAHALLADAYTHLGRAQDAQRERALARNASAK